MPEPEGNAWGCLKEVRGMESSPRWLWVVVIIIGVVLVVGGLYAWRQRAARAYEERTREEVERQLYQEKELGHPPGQLPAPPRR
jgi:hypothetical protein